MRDIVLTMFVFGTLPFILKRPWLGIFMWVWLGIMNPHRLSWGFAYDYPFSQMVAVVTLIGLLFEKRRSQFPWTAPTVFLFLFVFWMSISTLFALVPQAANDQWFKVMKIMFMVFVSLVALYERRHAEWLVWALAVSIGFYGVKGGIFTVLGGGEDRVYGPAGTFIQENNALAMATIMTIPLIWYLRTYATKPWMRLALLGCVVLCAASALGSYSRGAIVTMIPMMGFLWLKSRHNKLMLAILVIALTPLLVSIMPEQWFNRMESINTYEEDASAMGRINAWQTAFNLAKDRPFVGGGFEIYDAKVFMQYSPNPEDIHAAHSIYFAALGEHGWVGLALFLMFGLTTWRTASWIARRTKDRPDLKRDADLALMIQVSMVGYAVGGAFLSVLYFDLPYYLMVVLVLLKTHVEKVLTETPSQAKATIAGAASPQSSIPLNPGRPRSS